MSGINPLPPPPQGGGNPLRLPKGSKLPKSLVPETGAPEVPKGPLPRMEDGEIQRLRNQGVKPADIETLQAASRPLEPGRVINTVSSKKTPPLLPQKNRQDQTQQTIQPATTTQKVEKQVAGPVLPTREKFLKMSSNEQKVYENARAAILGPQPPLPPTHSKQVKTSQANSTNQSEGTRSVSQPMTPKGQTPDNLKLSESEESKQEFKNFIQQPLFPKKSSKKGFG